MALSEIEPTKTPMNAKKVINLGASGNIAKHVIDVLIKQDHIQLTLFLRSARRLKKQRRLQCENY